MMKHEVLITLIGNMFIDAYVAGDRKDLESFRTARADRDQLYDEVNELYAELEQESCNREQFEIELKSEQEHVRSLYETIRKLQAELQPLHEERYCKSDVDAMEWLKKNTNVFDDIPDDAGKFSEQDLPFPEVEGGDDVAGQGPATTEASAEAEGEASDPDEYLKREV